jgi:hypothetical protein
MTGWDRVAREAVAEKARRYVTEGRLRVVYIRPIDSRIRATVRGDGQTYRCGFEPLTGWFCDCPARTNGCAHLLGLRLVVEPSAEGPF